MIKRYVSCETLDDWFNLFEDEDEKNWIISEIIDNLCSGLADTNILLVETTIEDDIKKLRNINNAIVSALRDLKKLNAEVHEAIKNGDVLMQGRAKKGGATQ